ncbi:MAG: TraB/GumN family protein [Nanoarchaeota archaeon]|nr:TraB/GumN family protein [Nanoarchaeota archaeon]MCG2718624.1 TraB/GumN family protein [Nanoarchaeota archaeon]
MRKYRNLTIIGTSHIAIESVQIVEKVILGNNPNIVALELDPLRFLSLISNKKRKLKLTDIKILGFKGFLINLIGAWVEKKLGELVGTPPGSDMVKAAQTAKKIGADIALIDQDIRITLKKLSKSITWKEKLRFVWDIIKGIILRKPIVKFDLRKVPSEAIIEKLTSKIKADYPSFYKVLIDDRNKFMSKGLYKLMSTDRSIVAVVGAGHEKDIIKLLKKKFENG